MADDERSTRNEQLKNKGNLFTDEAARQQNASYKLVRLIETEKSKTDAFAESCGRQPLAEPCEIGIYTLNAYATFMGDVNHPPECLYRSPLRVVNQTWICVSKDFLKEYKIRLANHSCMIGINKIFDASHVSSESVLEKAPSLKNLHLDLVNIIWWLDKNPNVLMNSLLNADSSKDVCFEMEDYCLRMSFIKIHKINKDILAH